MRLLALALLLFPPAARAGAFTPDDFLRFDAGPAEIASGCAAAVKRADSRLAVVAALPPAARDFDRTVWALDRALSDLSDETASDVFLEQVSVSSAVRDAARACDESVSRFDAGVYSRRDLYAAVSGFAAGRPDLRGEDARLLEKTLLDFRRAGLDLPDGDRARVLEIRKRLAELEVRFERNIDEDRSRALFTRAQLAGLPDAYVAKLRRESGLYAVGVDDPEYFPFMEQADDPAARRELKEKFDERAAALNMPVLREALSLRLEEARLLGYRSHDAFVLETAMAKDPRTVRRFLERLRKRLRPAVKKELAVLRALKEEREGARSGPIQAWDWRYYDRLLRERRFRVDRETVREYFPSDLVVSRMLEVYQKLLGLRFREVADAAVWDSGVRLFSVADAGGGPPIAYFYLDLYPRPGKYPHAAAFPLIAERLLPSGGRRIPVSALVANLDEPSPDRPSLLDHDQLLTLFREFGRVMHQALSRARYGRFSGSNVARDFVEAPSLMLENWVWDPDVLRSLSGWYKDRAKPLPRELAERLIAARDADVALKTSRQIFFAEIDQEYHGPRPPAHPTRAYARLKKKVEMIPMIPGTHPEASFGHLMGGYSGGYYGYLWSKVCAQDMFSVFEDQGLANPVAGTRYRTEVLEQGSSRPEEETLEAFLGRAPGDAAFLKSVGLDGR
jgi:Zn-dependent oligopeptidase